MPPQTTAIDNRRIVAGLPFVEGLARRMASSMPHSIDIGDLIQDGVLGLIDAAHRFDETRGIKRAGIHRVSYRHGVDGLRGLALAVGAIIAAMPAVMEELGAAGGQRLVSIHGLAPGKKRYDIVDPRRDPPRYWRG